MISYADLAKVVPIKRYENWVKPQETRNTKLVQDLDGVWRLHYRGDPTDLERGNMRDRP